MLWGLALLGVDLTSAHKTVIKLDMNFASL